MWTWCLTYLSQGSFPPSTDCPLIVCPLPNIGAFSVVFLTLDPQGMGGCWPPSGCCLDVSLSVQEPIHDVLVSERGGRWTEALCPLQPLGSGLPPPAPLSQLPAPTPHPAPPHCSQPSRTFLDPVFPGPMGHPESFPDSVSSSQLNVPNPSTEEAVLQGWLESVGKNTECAGTSHPIHHCPCLPVVPSLPCLAENWP